VRTFWLTTTFLTLSVASSMAAVTPVLAPGQPQASIFAPANCTATPGNTGSCYSWTYELTLAESTKLDVAQSELDLLVIYDFAGFTGSWTSSMPGWDLIGTPTVGPFGTDGADLNAPYAWYPTGTDPFDQATVQNLIFEYTGAPIDATAFNAAPVLLTIESIYNLPTPGYFRGQGTKVDPNSQTVNNTAHETASGVDVPQTNEGGGEVPEPATMGLLGSALAAFGLLKRRRQ
jgi:hypothetical protein